MPIITCGGMRMQQTWKPGEGFSMNDVTAECQANFEAIVDRAMALGINHFETARGYGCSEVRDCWFCLGLTQLQSIEQVFISEVPHHQRRQIQYGQALKRHPRERMIIQTKVGRWIKLNLQCHHIKHPRPTDSHHPPVLV